MIFQFHADIVLTRFNYYSTCICPFLQILAYTIFLLVFKTPWQGAQTTIYCAVWQGAQTTIYCAVSEELEGVSGQYLADCKIQRPKTAAANDDSMADRLWQLSCRMVGLEEEKVEERND